MGASARSLNSWTAAPQARSMRPAGSSRLAASTAIATSTSPPAMARGSRTTSSPGRDRRPAAGRPPCCPLPRSKKAAASRTRATTTTVADATKDVTQRELPALIEKGYTSFKIYMTYEDLKLDDRQIIEVLALARRQGAMTMIHAENSDCIAWLTEQLLDAGLTAPRHHGSSRPMAVEREA